MSVTSSFSSAWGTCWSGAVKRPDPGGRSLSSNRSPMAGMLRGVEAEIEKRRLQHDSGILHGHLHGGEMSSKMRPRRRDSPRAGTVGQAERSTRYRNLVNPFEPVRIFSDDQVESMHAAALGILERQGMRVLSPRGRAVLAAGGATVDESRQMVRLDPALVAGAVASVPAESDLIAGNPQRSCRVGGPHV